MQKRTSFVLVFLLIALLLTGCAGQTSTEPIPSGGNPASEATTAPTVASEPTVAEAENEPAPEANALGGIYQEAGMELNDFYAAFNDGMGAFEAAVNAFETDDFELMNVGGDFISPTAQIVSMTQFDYLQDGDNAHEEGKNGKFDAVRDRDGDVITFSQSMTREEDGFGPTAKKGDVVSEVGTLNTATNTLVMESKTERDGAVIARSVIEVVMLPDGTFIAQQFEKPQAPEDDRIEDKGRAYFVRFTANELELVAAEFAPDVNFAYESIVGQTDVTLESMAEGYTKVRQLNVKDGVATATKF
jgi:hypothetical protein